MANVDGIGIMVADVSSVEVVLTSVCEIKLEEVLRNALREVEFALKDADASEIIINFTDSTDVKDLEITVSADNINGADLVNETKFVVVGAGKNKEELRVAISVLVGSLIVVPEAESVEWMFETKLPSVL